MQKTSNQIESHTCEFCNKSFMRETTLINHLCTGKARWLLRDQKNVFIAHQAWIQFYQTSGVSKKSTLEYKDFIQSRYYDAFVGFANFCLENKVGQWRMMVEFLIKNCIPLRDWAKQSTLQAFIKHRNQHESIAEALERSIMYADEWAGDNETALDKFYDEVNTYAFVSSFLAGKLSPWLIYISRKSHKLLDRLDDGQLKLLEKMLDPKLWGVKMQNNKEEVQSAATILEEYGL